MKIAIENKLNIVAVNDLADIKLDRKHPIKKKRPIASKKLNVQEITFVIFILLVVSLILSVYFSLSLFLIALAFTLLNFVYSFYLKKIPIVDLFAIAFSFVLRALAGEVITGYDIASWLLLSIFFLSLFVATIKRQSELLRIGVKARPVLKSYSKYLLNFLSSMFATLTIITYSLYTYFENPIYPKSQLIKSILNNVFPLKINRWMMISIPLVVLGISRYSQLLYDKEKGERPEKLIFTDKPLIFILLTWGITIIILIYLI